MFRNKRIISLLFGVAGLGLSGKILNDENNERNKIHTEIWSESYWKDLPDKRHITNQIIKYNKQLKREGRKLATNDEMKTLWYKQHIKKSIEL